MSIKPVHKTRTVYRWLVRHRAISEEWIDSVVIWTIKPKNIDEFILEKNTKINEKRKKIKLWIKDYNWRYLAHKIHMETN